MSRPSSSSKEEADSLRQVSINWLSKEGYLKGYVSGAIYWTNNTTEKKNSVGIQVSTIGDGYIRFIYTQTDSYSEEKKDFDYKFKLTATPCHFGGKRYWFICGLATNGKYCGRRVGVLYKGGDYFGCRHCYNLTYSSKMENRKYDIYPFLRYLDLLDKADKYEEQVKRQFYKGKPTKRHTRYENVVEKLQKANTLLKLGKLL